MLASRRWWRDDGGATAVEYGLVACLVACAIVAAVCVIGSDVGSVFGSISGQLGDAPTAGPPPAAPNSMHGGL